MSTIPLVEVIPAHGSIDTITVIWQDFNQGQGQVTLICWGSAWTCYFGGMPSDTIRQFFMRADVEYLVNKLGCTRWLKQTKEHSKYLERIIRAVQQTEAPKEI